MGCYINPKGMTKEAFLIEKGKPTKPGWPEDKDDALVCLIDNGAFTAAGICWCKRELESFAFDDDRPKDWFLVKKADLTEFMNGQKFED